MAGLHPSTFDVGPVQYPIDRYSQSGSARRPVVVIFHGVDGMVDESGAEIHKLATQIADDGYVVFVPHYFGAERPGSAMPTAEMLVQRTMLADTFRPRVAAAVTYALAQPQSDSARLGVVGLSRRGTGAMVREVGTLKGTVRGVVDFFGHISDRAIYANATALPPTLVFHNNSDGIVASQFSVDLIAALKQQGVVHDGTFYDEPPYPERRNHTFRPGGTADIDSRARTRKWLDTSSPNVLLVR